MAKDVQYAAIERQTEHFRKFNLEQRRYRTITLSIATNPSVFQSSDFTTRCYFDEILRKFDRLQQH